MRVSPAMIINELSKHSKVRPKGLKSNLEIENTFHHYTLDLSVQDGQQTRLIHSFRQILRGSLFFQV